MPPQAAGVLAFGEQSVELSRQGRASVENLLRESRQITSSLVAMVGTACTPVPKASSHTERGAEIRSGSYPVSAASSQRPAALATPRKPPHPRSCHATKKAWCAASRCSLPRPHSSAKEWRAGTSVERG